jgi:hypothetical protein
MNPPGEAHIPLMLVAPICSIQSALPTPRCPATRMSSSLNGLATSSTGSAWRNVVLASSAPSLSFGPYHRIATHNADRQQPQRRGLPAVASGSARYSRPHSRPSPKAIRCITARSEHRRISADGDGSSADSAFVAWFVREALVESGKDARQPGSRALMTQMTIFRRQARRREVETAGPHRNVSGRGRPPDMEATACST